MTWPGQEYATIWSRDAADVIRESGRIRRRTRFRNRLMLGLLVIQVCLGVLQFVLFRSLWMLLPFAANVGLMCLVVWAGRADVRKAECLRERAKAL